MLISLFLVDHAAADIPFLALSPGLAIDKVQTQHTRTRAVPSASMLGEGDAGSERPSPPRAPSLTTCLPTPISGVGTQRGWRAGGWGGSSHWEDCGGPEPRRGLNFLLSGLQESHPASGGSANVLASSHPAAAGPSLPPAPPARAGGCGAQGAGGPRRARPGSQEGPATRLQGRVCGGPRGRGAGAPPGPWRPRSPG